MRWPVVTEKFSVCVADWPGFSATGLAGDETVQPGAGASASRSNEPGALPTLVTVTSKLLAVFSPRYCSAGLTCTKGKGTAGTLHESLSLAVSAPLSWAVATTVKG